MFEGLDQRAMAGNTRVSGRASPTVRLSLDRSARLSSETLGCQFESNFEPLALPLDCSQSVVEIGVI
jgi:hypothetical protein